MIQLPMLPHDKANHFIYGAVIFTATNLIPHVAPIWALVAAAIFGIGKEFVDLALNKLAEKRGHLSVHGVEPLDAIATFVGGALCYLNLFI